MLTWLGALKIPPLLPSKSFYNLDWGSKNQRYHWLVWVKSFELSNTRSFNAATKMLNKKHSLFSVKFFNNGATWNGASRRVRCKNIINPLCGVCHPSEVPNPWLLWLKYVSRTLSPSTVKNENRQKIEQAERKPSTCAWPRRITRNLKYTRSVWVFLIPFFSNPGWS